MTGTPFQKHVGFSPGFGGLTQVEADIIRDKDVELAITIIVENRHTISGGFQNKFLVRAATIGVGHLETGRSGDVDKVHPAGVRDCERRDKYDPYGEANDP